MPGKVPMPATVCPGSVTWSGVENWHGEDANNGLGAFTAAYNQAQGLANKEMNKFEAQKCPGGCFQSNVRADPVITIPQPIQKKPVKGKGMEFVCDLTWEWSDTIYCYKNAKDKKDADDEREKERLEKQKKAKEEGK